MGILNNHIKKSIRFSKGDLVIYEPNEFQYEEIMKLIENNISTDENLNAKGEVGIQGVRYLIRELTSIGAEIDEMSDSELAIAFDNGDRDLTIFLRELKKLIEEIVEDVQYKQYEAIDMISKMFDILNAQEDENIIKNKFNKLCKKKGIKMTFDEFIELQTKPEELKERMTIKKVNKKKK